jgi:hypothetical protein
MKKNLVFFLALLPAMVSPARLQGQTKEIEANVQPTSEIRRLFEAFSGDWTRVKKESARSFFRMEANARADPMCGWQPAAPC